MRGEWERSSYGWTDLKPTTALNSSFHCAPKVSLQSSIFQDREVENSEATCFWRNLDFLSFYLVIKNISERTYLEGVAVSYYKIIIMPVKINNILLIKL